MASNQKVESKVYTTYIVYSEWYIYCCACLVTVQNQILNQFIIPFYNLHIEQYAW